MTRLSLLYLLCQCESLAELETTAREFGCVDLQVKYGAMHLMLPDGVRGSFRESRDAARGIRGHQFIWCAADSAE
jgi:hypothetical protein